MLPVDEFGEKMNAIAEAFKREDFDGGGSLALELVGLVEESGNPQDAKQYVWPVKYAVHALQIQRRWDEIISLVEKHYPLLPAGTLNNWGFINSIMSEAVFRAGQIEKLPKYAFEAWCARLRASDVSAMKVVSHNTRTFAHEAGRIDQHIVFLEKVLAFAKEEHIDDLVQPTVDYIEQERSLLD